MTVSAELYATQLAETLLSLDSWEFDVFVLEELVQNNVLVYMAYTLFRKVCAQSRPCFVYKGGG